VETNKELIRRWIEFAEGGFRGDFANFISYLGATHMDRAELERLERAFLLSFPDTTHIIEELLSDGDRVILRATMKATHRGLFQGIAPTDRTVEFTAMVIYRIHEGKIAESWGEIDFLRLIRQLRAP
jgi:predicted ester cyclase